MYPLEIARNRSSSFSVERTKPFDRLRTGQRKDLPPATLETRRREEFLTEGNPCFAEAGYAGQAKVTKVRQGLFYHQAGTRKNKGKRAH